MDTRRRTLIILGSAVLLFAAAAALALHQRAAEGAARYTPVNFLPGFAARAKDAARIDVLGHDGGFAVTLGPAGWVLADRGGYPADFNEVRQTLITLAQLVTIAPKTSRPDWLHYLSLDTPPQGLGTALTVKDAKGAVLARLLFGKVEDLGGASAIFVRRPGDDQSYLARAVFPLHGDVAYWMTKNLFDMGPGRLQQVVVQPATGAGFTVGRARPTDPVNVLNGPKGAQVDFQLVNDLGYAVASFAVADVRPAAGLDFAGASHVIARSFDGLAVTFAVVRAGQGGDAWTEITAAPAPAAPGAIVREADAINARTKGWAFKLPPQEANVMLSDLKRLMTPPPPKPGIIETPGTAP
jgi:hypothetical protein